MAKQINQETFDDVVKENIVDFEMSIEDAVSDAVQQFEAQGVDVSNIVKDASHFDPERASEKHGVVVAVETLQSFLESPASDADVSKWCNTLKNECDVDLARRCLASKSGAYNAVFDLTNKYLKNRDVILPVLDAWCSLCNGQPDILDLRGTNLLVELAQDGENSEEVLLRVLTVIRHCCVMHEHNRQSFVTKGIIAVVVGVMTQHQRNLQLVKEACAVLRTLTLDDDVRVPFGKAHEHAKMIVTEADALRVILSISKDFRDDKALLGEMFLTLSKLAVRNEFCQEIMDLGGLELMHGALENCLSDKVIVIDALKVMKAIAGNDHVKDEIVRLGGVSLVLGAMTTHPKQPILSEIACACIAVLSLRKPDHCRAFMENNAAEVLVKALTLHPSHAGAQKQACMAIRNLVARTRDHATQFLSLGVEPLLQRTLRTHASCADEAKAALRDLDLKVELKTPWMGEGKGITR